MNIAPVVFVVEELDLFEGLGAGPVAHDVGVKLEKGVQGCGPSFLRSDHKEIRKSVKKKKHNYT